MFFSLIVQFQGADHDVRSHHHDGIDVRFFLPWKVLLVARGAVTLEVQRHMCKPPWRERRKKNIWVIAMLFQLIGRLKQHPNCVFFNHVISAQCFFLKCCFNRRFALLRRLLITDI